jgi:hypothetical protein
VTALDDLAAELRSDGGLLAAALRDGALGAPLPAGARTEVQVLLEAIREGYELHYGQARLLATEDADLALLAGDRLYALGLERLAALGDLDAVRTLADLISQSARAHAEGRPELADAAWAKATDDVHRTGTPEPGAHAARKGAARAYSPEQ